MAIERIVPGTREWEAFYANHICRYQFAKEHIESASATSVLDAASGVGYGSSFLGSDSRLRITAVDNSREALDIANKTFSRSNVTYLEDDCHSLTSASVRGPFDCIVSFETFEHLPRPEQFLDSAVKNLKPGGILIISTPNRLVSSPTGKVDWEYHEREFEPDEFLAMLLAVSSFSSIRLFGQQLTSIGKLRAQVRGELNRINSNPFMRIGRKMQEVLRGHQSSPIMAEQKEDFEIIEFEDSGPITAAASDGPFVLIAVCTK